MHLTLIYNEKLAQQMIYICTTPKQSWKHFHNGNYGAWTLHYKNNYVLSKNQL